MSELLLLLQQHPNISGRCWGCLFLFFILRLSYNNFNMIYFPSIFALLEEEKISSMDEKLWANQKKTPSLVRGTTGDTILPLLEHKKNADSGVSIAFH